MLRQQEDVLLTKCVQLLNAKKRKIRDLTDSTGIAHTAIELGKTRTPPNEEDSSSGSSEAEKVDTDDARSSDEKHSASDHDSTNLEEDTDDEEL